MPQKNPAQPAQPTFIEEVFAYAEITEHYAQSVDANLVDQSAPPVLLLGEQMIEARVHDPETRISPTSFAGYIAVAMVQRAPERGYTANLLREVLQIGDSGRHVEFRGAFSLDADPVGKLVFKTAMTHPTPQALALKLATHHPETADALTAGTSLKYEPLREVGLFDRAVATYILNEARSRVDSLHVAPSNHHKARLLKDLNELESAYRQVQTHGGRVLGPEELSGLAMTHVARTETWLKQA